jgi:anion-transporting  ArsA/GET3 family ATPase
VDEVRYQFIWGAGGVGKSHVAIRKSFEAKGQRLLLTLDPSRRLFYLLGHSPNSSEPLHERSCQLGEESFLLRQTNAHQLFEELEARVPAPAGVKAYFLDLVSGLQRFRDYLSLIELGDAMRASSFDRILIDTPPFHEAQYFQQSILQLHEFFDRSLIQIGLRNEWLQVGVRKALEGVRLFTGKKNLEESLHFLDWLVLHVDRLQKSAQNLHENIFSPKAEHLIVLTPESDLEEIAEMQNFFQRSSRLVFVINRSLKHFSIKEALAPPFDEFSKAWKKEQDVSARLQQMYPNAQIEKIPLQLMGDDSLEELLQFVRA